MKIGYIRISKKDQNPEIQCRDLLAFGCEKIFEEQISSRKADRPELRAMLEYVREGDALVIWKLDRFGRSLKELIELVRASGGRAPMSSWSGCTGARDAPACRPTCGRPRNGDYLRCAG